MIFGIYPSGILEMLPKEVESRGVMPYLDKDIKWEWRD